MRGSHYSKTEMLVEHDCSTADHILLVIVQIPSDHNFKIRDVPSNRQGDDIIM